MLRGAEDKMKPDADSSHPLIRKRHESIPIEALLGIEVGQIGGGRASGTLQVGPQHANPVGTLQGGVLCSFVDATMGMALASTLEPDESFTSMNLQIHFFRPVVNGSLRAEARVFRRGKRVGYLECEVNDESGKLVAKASSECLIVRSGTDRE
jgi:uncharacterized protein (TIGR00369 family)